jgi:outer membrane lipoprotein carrier protein
VTQTERSGGPSSHVGGWLRRLGCALLLVCGAPWAEAADAADAADVIAKVEAKYGPVTALKASFTQITRSEALGDQQQSGRLAVERPSKMRWDFAGYGRQFITDGSTMWIYNPADKQVLRYSDFSTAAATADALLQSLDKLSELFDVELRGTEPGPVLGLRPKGEQSQVKELQLSLTAELLVSKVQIVDGFGGITELAFENVELPDDIPDEQFTFTVPEGVEVVDAGSL